MDGAHSVSLTADSGYGDSASGAWAFRRSLRRRLTCALPNGSVVTGRGSQRSPCWRPTRWRLRRRWRSRRGRGGSRTTTRRSDRSGSPPSCRCRFGSVYSPVTSSTRPRRSAAAPRSSAGSCTPWPRRRACTGLVALLVGAQISRAWLLLTFGFALITVEFERSIVRFVFRRARARGQLQRRVVIIGANAEALEVVRMLRTNSSLGYDVVGIVECGADNGVVSPVPVLGNWSDTLSIVKSADVSGVIIATSSVDIGGANRLARELMELGYHVELTSGLVDISADRSDRPAAGPPAGHVRRAGAPVGLASRGQARLRHRRRRPQCCSCSCRSLAVAAILIKLDSRGPVFFSQARVGKDGKLFRVRKLRTMVTDAEQMLDVAAGQERGRRPAVQDARTTLASPGSARFLREVLDRRAAPALERAARRDEPRRSPSGAPERDVGVDRRLQQPAPGQARHHGHVAGQRPQQLVVRRLRAARPLLRRQLVAADRPRDRRSRRSPSSSWARAPTELDPRPEGSPEGRVWRIYDGSASVDDAPAPQSARRATPFGPRRNLITMNSAWRRAPTRF